LQALTRFNTIDYLAYFLGHRVRMGYGKQAVDA